MGHHDPETPEYEREDNRTNGALLIYLFLRDVHIIRSSVVEMKKNTHDVDP